jgi:DHA1 family bicyclomycin/chloramphenicol resistance-like MFS transporter
VSSTPPAGSAATRASLSSAKPDLRLIILLGALAACGPLSIDMYLPSLPSIAKAFVTSDAAAQATLTTFMCGFSLGMLVYGPLSDAWGRRPVLLGGVLMYLLATVACAFSTDIDTLMIARFIQALGAGAASVLARAIARDAHTPAQAARVLSMVALVTACGPLLAPLIGGQLLLLGSWRFIFVVLGCFGAACTVAVIFKVPETWPLERRHPSALRDSFSAYGKLLADPVAWGHVLCGGMAFAAMFAYITATPFVYIDYFHIPAQHYGMFFGVNVIGIMGGNYLNTRLVARLGPVPIISVAACLSCAASVLVFLACLTGIGGLWSIVVSLFLVVAVVGVLSANCTTHLMLRYPNNAGAAAALFGAMQLAMGALASIAVGWFHDGTPIGMGIVVGVCGLLCFAGRYLVLKWNTRPRRGIPASA